MAPSVTLAPCGRKLASVHAELSELRRRLRLVRAGFEIRRQTRQRIRRLGLLCHCGFGPFRPLVDPVAYQIRLFPGQRVAFVRHDVVVAFGQGDPTVDLAFPGIAGHDDHAVLAALHRGLFRVQPQFGLLLFRPVAFDAVLLEERQNLFGEINLVFRADPPACERHQRDGNGNELLHIICIINHSIGLRNLLISLSDSLSSSCL